MNKTDAINEILKLAKEHDIDLSNVTAPSNKPESNKKPIGSIFSYLGGLFILSGIAVIICLNWDMMNSISRVLITFGLGEFLFCYAFVINARSEKGSPFTTPLFLLSAVLIPVGYGVILFEYFNTIHHWHLSVMGIFALTLCQTISTHLIRTQSILWFINTVLFSALIMVSLDYFHISYGMNLLTTGLSLFLINESSGHIQGLSPYRSLWRVISSFWIFMGLSFLFFNKPYELVFILFVLLGLYVSTKIHSKALLVVTSLYLLNFLGYYIPKTFSNTLNIGLLLIIMGLIFLMVGAGLLRLYRNQFAKK